MTVVGASTLTLVGACSTSGGGENSASQDIGVPATANIIAMYGRLNQIGRITSQGNSDYRTFHEYDALGRSTKIQHVMHATSYLYQTTYGYPQTAIAAETGLGSVVTAETLPDNEQVSYAYDAAATQRSITSTPAGKTAQPIVSAIVRNPRKQTTRVDYGNGVHQYHCYNDGISCNGSSVGTDLRLRQIVTTHNGGIQEYDYRFDAQGNLTALTDALDADLSSTFAYDSRNQIAAATRAGQTGYFSYDALGNLTCKGGAAPGCGNQSYAAPGHLHAVSTGASGESYAYDSNGNALTAGSTTLTWNAENMPVSAVTSSGRTAKSFVGEHLWKKSHGASVTYYLPDMRVEDGAPRKYYGAFAERSPDGNLRFYQGDRLGSADLVTDATGTVVHRAAYAPYGTDLPVSGYPAYAESFTPVHQFTAQEKESDGSGLYDFGARLYNPGTGRFLSADNSTADGLNRYAYATNNPVRYNDPTGHGARDAAPLSDQAFEAIDAQMNATRTSTRLAMTLDAISPVPVGGVIDKLVNIDQTARSWMEAVIGAPDSAQGFLEPVALGSLIAGSMQVQPTINPARVNFVQSSVRETFTDANSNLNATIDALRGPKGSAVARSVPPVRIFEQDGKLYTLDHRRVLAFSHADQRVPFVHASLKDLLNASLPDRYGRTIFTATPEQAGGRFIRIRPADWILDDGPSQK
jgi:RHS repeat-associated protein